KEEDEILIDESTTIRRKTKFGSIVVEENTLKLSWSELNHGMRDKINILSQAMMNQKISSWQEGTTYGRFEFWARQQKLNIEEISKDLKASDFFEFNDSLKWEGFEDFLKTTVEE